MVDLSTNCFLFLRLRAVQIWGLSVWLPYVDLWDNHVEAILPSSYLT